MHASRSSRCTAVLSVVLFQFVSEVVLGMWAFSNAAELVAASFVHFLFFLVSCFLVASVIACCVEYFTLVENSYWPVY